MPSSLHRQRSLGAASTAFPSAGALPPADGSAEQWQEMAVLAEAHHLRKHQKRLEERGMVLEDQNRQLQMQLERLQRLIEKVCISYQWTQFGFVFKKSIRRVPACMHLINSSPASSLPLKRKTRTWKCSVWQCPSGTLRPAD